MSGTSMDGVDGVVLELPLHSSIPFNFPSPQQKNQLPKLLAHANCPLPADFRSELIALNMTGTNELHRAALAGNSLSLLYANVVQQLLEKTHLQPHEVAAIGAHGQTVRHQPNLHDGIGYTLQLGNPALLAERTQITVVADFRSRDIAAGGQGAPLVPAFHQYVFAAPDKNRLILNIGGIANLTVLPASGAVIGFDCGPGNALMDFWSQTHTGKPYDDAGEWAATGQVIPSLLQHWLQEPYFLAPPPKSTGRDLFNSNWLKRSLEATNSYGAAPCDVQATLAELTGVTCISAALAHSKNGDLIAACGGGVFNTHLMHRIQALAHNRQVTTTESIGLPPMQVECAAFAWLAQQAMNRVPASIPSVTGAQSKRILGAIYSV
jgi:anhydro-N-acetylmuramic acid kinase